MTKNKERPTLTVDALIEDEQGRILLIKRGVKPFKGEWCLPGGKVDAGERVEAALEREVIEELGIRIGIRELVGVYSDPDRDPRGHFVTVVYHATIIGGEPTVTDEAADILWVERHEEEELEIGFDHAMILEDWWQRRNDAVRISRSNQQKGERPQLRKHPVDPMVEQVEDERIEGKRLVEDEAGRGKRLTKIGGGAGASAQKMSGHGTKRTAAAGKAPARKR
jgi:8-oxo-dGTP diphosphatase